jgi:hypothetical protein
MSSRSASPGHIEITETLVRLYVFLAQYLDRSRDERLRQSYRETDLQAHLTSTKSKMLEILSVNPVVKEKVRKECDRILALGAACLKEGAENRALLDDVKAERALLQNKTIALSDLLAVFRAS